MTKSINTEQRISDLHSDFFYKYFVFSTNKIRSQSGELEFADNFLYLDEDCAIIYQIKERNKKDDEVTIESEKKWFENKVIKTGSKQINDSENFLKRDEVLVLKNLHGMSISISKNIQKIHKIIIYKSNNKGLPLDCYLQKFYESKTAGIIHLFPEDMYNGIIYSLVTIAELNEYLSFREYLITLYPDEVNEVCEKSLIGQFLKRDIESKPNYSFSKYYDIFVPLHLERESKWDFSGVLSSAYDRADNKENAIKWVTEIAKLNRFELEAIKEKWKKLMNNRFNRKYEEDDFLMIGRTKCFIIFMPRSYNKKREEIVEEAKNYINHCVNLPTSDFTAKCYIGISFSKINDEEFENIIIYSDKIKNEYIKNTGTEIKIISPMKKILKKSYL